MYTLDARNKLAWNIDLINGNFAELKRSLDAAHTVINVHRNTIASLRNRVDKLEPRPFNDDETPDIATALHRTLHDYYHTAGEGDIEHALKMAEELRRRLTE